jgi:hypothetical protein
MTRKTGMDSEVRKIELINGKVREINERRRAMKITAVEDELDRQELHKYIRILGMEPDTISLESMEKVTAPRNKIFYATLFTEGLIEVAVLYFLTSLIFTPGASETQWVMCIMLAAIFVYLGYRMFKEYRGR